MIIGNNIILLFQVHQVIASELGVDMSLIKIKSALNIASPNATVTGGSFGSELNCAVSNIFDIMIQWILLFHSKH